MDFLPEPLQNNPTLETLLTHSSSTLAHLQTLRTTLTSLRTDYLTPYILTPLSHLVATSQMPDLVSILLLAAILLVSLKILDYARRIVMFWVALLFKVLFWGALLFLAVWLYNAGWESVLREGGWLWGLGRGVVDGFNEGW